MVAAFSGKRSAVFLDRDGVLNQSLIRDGKPYPPADVSQLVVFSELATPLMALRTQGWLAIVVTNQPDVARGTQTLEAVTAINEAVSEQLPLDEIRVCYHSGNDCNCRKPKPGMLLEAAAAWNIDLSKSWMIGDRWRDIEAGKAAGCRTIFVDYHYVEPRGEPDRVVASPLAAVQYLMKMELT